jgi:thiamine-phosphate pyrophosphorylase
MNNESHELQPNHPFSAVTPQAATASQRLGLLRIIDANSNRAAEGLRVAEEYVRFILDDQHLTRLCKQLRHDLASAMIPFSRDLLDAVRETQADVGAGVTTAQEYQRSNLHSVLAANLSRVEQSLRALEEYGKVIEPSVAATLEQLRYRTYTLQRIIGVTASSCERLADRSLYVLIDGGTTCAAMTEQVKFLIRAGVHVLQLRDKMLTDRELLERARRMRELTSDCDTLFIVNDRADIAAAAHADGVHVGQDELSVKDVRTIVGPEMLIGVSTHSLQQARQAVLDGANYIGVGPTFPSSTKPFDSFPGIELLRAVSAEISLPSFAIGGITAENLPQVVASGFTRVAVRDAVTGAADPAATVGEILAMLPVAKHSTDWH